jgi:hypothetical protein
MRKLPILQVDIELTPEQVKQMDNAARVLERMDTKGKPGSFIAQIRYITNDFGATNRAMNFTPRIKCYLIPQYLAKRIIRTIERATNPANKIPRRNYWKAAAAGILRYIKNTEVNRKSFRNIDQASEPQPFEGRYCEKEIDDDIPF